MTLKAVTAGALLLLVGCSPVDETGTSGQKNSDERDNASVLGSTVPVRDCDADLTLPEGFCAEVFHEGIGKGARHLAVRDNGDVFVAVRGEPGGLFAFRDSNGDGKADQQERWSPASGTGVEIRNNYVYFSTPETVMRFEMDATLLTPVGEVQIVIDGYPDYRMHASKALAFDQDNHLYVNIGAPSNACQEPSRTPGVAGQDPCPLLESTAGVWRFNADTLGQNGPEDGERYATGIRNGLAMDWNPQTDQLYLVQHGRDQLNELWPDLYTVQQRAELPAEQFYAVEPGSDFGWPYCYFDHQKGLKLLNPEYGGDGSKVGRCAEVGQPIAAYPGHWAPNDLVFYRGEAYPPHYRQGAFIAFHGSWNRAPFPQEGYRVVFQPFTEGKATETFETFMDGFSTIKGLKSPGSAKYRPTGLALDALGQLWVSDSRKGRVWRVRYYGTPAAAHAGG